MNCLRLESIRPELNRYRYYTLALMPTLWQTWGVACQWGRIGEDPRGAQIHECADRDTALCLAAQVIELRLRHGYMVKDSSL